MSYLSRDAILTANDIKTEDVDVPEWGGKVRVRAMTAIQRDNFELQHLKGTLKNFRALIASRCIVNEENENIFTEADIGRLSQKSSLPLSKIFEVAIRLSGITEKDVQNLEEN